MKRLSVLALSVVCIGGFAVLSSSSATADKDKTLTLFGKVDGIDSDGGFAAIVTVTEPVSKDVLYQGRTLVDVRKGEYVAHLPVDKGLDSKTYRVEMEGLEAAEEFSMVDFVQLQAGSPGTGQTGHLNISGNILAGKIGLGVAPALARLQINETGTLQGVRSITQDGVSVYGQSNAATGLGAGGYVTTSSVGGRGMVGDALSTTGATVGGLFFNRSDEGVAVWGRHINTQGASIGVFGQTSSADGTGVAAENTATGDKVFLAGLNGSIQSEGRLPQHVYAGSTPKTMVPYAYGTIGSTGSILTSSGNFTVSKISTGVYEIIMPNINFDVTDGAIMATAGATTAKFVCWDGQINSDDFSIRTFSSAGTAQDILFSFVVYVATAQNPAVRTMGRPVSQKLPPLPVDRTEFGGGSEVIRPSK